MIDVSKHYDTLTAPERLILAIDALGRGDQQEANRLGETCPKFNYNEQRDIAFTGQYQCLMTIALLHAASFYEARGAVLAARMLTLDEATYTQRRAELVAHIAAWQRFCDYVGLDPVATMKAFGFTLNAMLDDALTGEPDEAIVDEIYQTNLMLWQS
jgi:hypothetical protein